MEDNNTNDKSIKKKVHRKKTIISIIGVIIILFLIIIIGRAYQRNKFLKFDSNFEASFATYGKGLECIVYNYDSYSSRLDAKELIIKGIDIAKNNEKNVPNSLKANYDEYISALERYSVDLNDNGDVNSYVSLMVNKIRDLKTKYNISQEEVNSNVSNILKEYNVN